MIVANTKLSNFRRRKYCEVIYYFYPVLITYKNWFTNRVHSYHSTWIKSIKNAVATKPAWRHFLSSILLWNKTATKFFLLHVFIWYPVTWPPTKSLPRLELSSIVLKSSKVYTINDKNFHEESFSLKRFFVIFPRNDRWLWNFSASFLISQMGA